MSRRPTPALVSLLPLLAVLATHSGAALASSHREAPFITTAPKVDGTDLYAFRSYEAGREDFVTLIANYQPLQDAYGGPNYFFMDPQALYEIHIDNDGDAIEDISYQFRFDTRFAQANAGNVVIDGTVNGESDPANPEQRVQVPLINLLPGTGAAPGLVNVVQTYTVDVALDGRRSGNTQAVTLAGGGGSSFEKPLDNIGAKSIPDYAGYANQFIYDVDIPDCPTSGRLFVGQRQEGFVVNLGQVFDQINLNPVGARNSASNIIGDKNITSLAIEVPTACLTDGVEPVIGVWTTASLRQARLLNPTPAGPADNANGRAPEVTGGAWTQVSRLGSPLVNEVVIGITDKDLFNASQPRDDVSNFASYVLYPSLPILVDALFPGATTVPATPRTDDLLPVFVTGIRANVNGSMVDFTHPANVDLNTLEGAGEMLRLNTAFPANPTPIGSQSDLGFLACDLGGFPNGRRPIDDVVDIALTVAEGALTGTNNLQTCDVSGPTPTVVNAGAIVNDGALPDPNDYLQVFPYLNTPIAGSP